MDANIQYISDTLFIEDIVKAEFSVSNTLVKTAVLSGAVEHVKSFVSRHIDTSSKEALIKSVLKLLEGGIFFKIHPVLWIVNQGAQAFGYSATDILSNIVSGIKEKLERGELPSAADVNQAGMSLVSDDVVLAFDFFSGLKKLAINRKPMGGSWFGGKGPWLERAFGFLGAKNSKILIIGFIVWFIKTILVSAGLLAGSEVLQGVVAPEKEETKNVSEPKQERESYTKVNVQMPASTPLRESGAGKEFYENDEHNSWYIKLINQNPAQTILNWAIDIYPELSGYEEIIIGNPAFKKVVDIISKDYQRGSDHLLMPIGFNRKIDVVNQFINSVYPEVQRAKHQLPS